MVISASLFGGAIFIISLGVWFAVTVASMTGISNVAIYINKFIKKAKPFGFAFFIVVHLRFKAVTFCIATFFY